MIEGVYTGDGHWCKAAAVTPAVRQADTDLVVIADADVWTDHLEPAIDHVARHGGWAIPHMYVHRLTRDATTAVIDGEDFAGQPLEQPPYEGVKGGGIVVLSRDDYLRVPLDPRFYGWGGEDHSWGYALKTLLGLPYRGQGPLWHLWHPSQPRRESRRHPYLAASEKLWQRYVRATGNPERITELVEEAKAYEPANAYHG